MGGQLMLPSAQGCKHATILSPGVLELIISLLLAH